MRAASAPRRSRTCRDRSGSAADRSDWLLARHADVRTATFLALAGVTPPTTPSAPNIDPVSNVDKNLGKVVYKTRNVYPITGQSLPARARTSSTCFARAHSDPFGDESYGRAYIYSADGNWKARWSEPAIGGPLDGHWELFYVSLNDRWRERTTCSAAKPEQLVSCSIRSVAGLHRDARSARRRCRCARCGLLRAAQAGAESAPQTEWSHRCSACGKCCNSPPQLSVPELFHHQRTFIGCLSVRRVGRRDYGGDDLYAGDARPRRRAGESLPGSPMTTVARSTTTASRFRVSRRAARCARGRPFAARGARRARGVEAAYLGADCIARGSREGYAPFVQRLRVVDEGALAALTDRRRALAIEKRFWGQCGFSRAQARAFCPARGPREHPGGRVPFAAARAGAARARRGVSVACRASAERIRRRLQLVLAERLARAHERPRDAASCAEHTACARARCRRAHA